MIAPADGPREAWFLGVRRRLPREPAAEHGRPAARGDIDRIIASVRQRMPDISVIQHEGTHPGDDDGVWFFDLPGVDGRIQLESSCSARSFRPPRASLEAGC